MLRDANVQRRVTDDERFGYYFVEVKVNVGCRWKVRECGRKVKSLR